MAKKKYCMFIGDGEDGVSIEMCLTETRYKFVKKLFDKFELEVMKAANRDELVNLEFEIREVPKTLTKFQQACLEKPEIVPHVTETSEEVNIEADDALKIIRQKQEKFFDSLIADFVPEDKQAEVRADVSAISFIDDINDVDELKTENI